METGASDRGRSRLELGVLVALAGLAVAALIGFVAVFDADGVAGAFGTGFGISVVIALGGATLASALACLARGTAELPALAGIAVSVLAMDLLALAIWLDIESEAYGKLTGLAFVWSFFGLVGLGLVLVVRRPATNLARALYVAALMAAVWAGVVATALVLSAGEDEVGISVATVPFAGSADEDLLRLLGAFLVLLASLWYAALAASRLDRPQPALERSA
jgi:hypothetical protein